VNIPDLIAIDLLQSIDLVLSDVHHDDQCTVYTELGSCSCGMVEALTRLSVARAAVANLST